VQDEVNQDYSEHNEVDGMKKGGDSTGKVMLTKLTMWKHFKSAPSKLCFSLLLEVCHIILPLLLQI